MNELKKPSRGIALGVVTIIAGIFLFQMFPRSAAIIAMGLLFLLTKEEQMKVFPSICLVVMTCIGLFGKADTLSAFLGSGAAVTLLLSGLLVGNIGNGADVMAFVARKLVLPVSISVLLICGLAHGENPWAVLAASAAVCVSGIVTASSVAAGTYAPYAEAWKQIAVTAAMLLAIATASVTVVIAAAMSHWVAIISVAVPAVVMAVVSGIRISREALLGLSIDAETVR